MKLGYDVHGTGGKRVIVLHDWSASCTTYDHCRPYMDTTTHSYAFVDLRGYGRSRDLAGAYSVAEAAADILAVARELGWDDFSVLGHSMTGMVAQRVALDAPDRVNAIIAVCAVSAQGMPLDDDSWAFFLGSTQDDEAYQDLMRGVCMDTLGAGWLAAKLRWNRAQATLASRVGYLHMFVKTNFAPEVNALTQPVLVITGAQDTEALNAKAMQSSFLDQHPRAEHRDIPNCGHYPMQECPPAFVAIVEEFLGRVVA